MRQSLEFGDWSDILLRHLKSFELASGNIHIMLAPTWHYPTISSRQHLFVSTSICMKLNPNSTNPTSYYEDIFDSTFSSYVP